MIFGIGIDCCEVKSIADEFAKDLDNIWIQTLFTENEVKYCSSKRYAHKHYAGMFSAKEACLKALGSGAKNLSEFKLVEVLHNADGKPEIKLYGNIRDLAKKHKINNILVSISHTNLIATAIVTMEI